MEAKSIFRNLRASELYTLRREALLTGREQSDGLATSECGLQAGAVPDVEGDKAGKSGRLPPTDKKEADRISTSAMEGG